jgi:hypothetical protein
VVAEDVLDERGVDVGQSAPTELLGPGHPDPACSSERLCDLTRVAVREHPLPPPLGVALERGMERRSERGRLLAQRVLFVGEAEVHARRC